MAPGAAEITRALTPVQEEPEAARPQSAVRTAADGDGLVLRCASRGSARPGSQPTTPAEPPPRSLPRSGSGLLTPSKGQGSPAKSGTPQNPRGKTLPQDPTGLLPRLGGRGERAAESQELVQLFRADPINLADIERLLKQKPKLVNKSEETFGWPPVMFAAHRGDVPLLKRILDARADHRAACHNGNTALQLAARGGHLGTVQFLISAKADLTTQNKNGWSALIWGASGGHKAEEGLDNGPGAQSSPEPQFWWQSQPAGTVEDVVEVLLEASAPPDACDEQGRNACMWAARNGHAGCVSTLASAGLDLSLRDADDLGVADHALNFHDLRVTILATERANRRLIESAKSGDLAGASRALQEGAAVNAHDSEGSSALGLAMSQGSGDLVKLLLQRGAQTGGEGTELPWGGMDKAERTCAAVEDALGTRRRFIAAAMDGKWEEAREALEAGAFVDAPDESGRTPCVWAAVHGSWQSLLWLGEARADLDRRDASGWAAAHYAAQRGELETVSALHHFGADFSIRTHEGQTLQHLAAGADCGQALQLLAAARADLAAVDAEQRVPAQVAAARGCAASLSALLALKADPKVQDHKSRSLFTIAAVHGHPAVLRLLVAPLGDIGWAECAGYVAKPKLEASSRQSSKRLSSKHSTSSDRLASPARKGNGAVATPDGQRKRNSLKSGLLPALVEVSSPKPTLSRKGSSSKNSVASSTGRTPKARQPTPLRPLAPGESWDSLIEVAFGIYESLPAKFSAPFSLSDALSQRDQDGRTALALSVESAQPRAQALLLELKAAPDAEDTEGNTALMLGAARDDCFAVERLIEAAAKTDARNKAGKGALELASQSRLRQVLKADLDRKLVEERLGHSSSLPALPAPAAAGDAAQRKLGSPKSRPQPCDGQRRFRLEGLRGDSFILEARIRKLFRKSCGAKLMHLDIALDPITESCRGFAHVDLAFSDRRSRLALDRDEVEMLLGDHIRLVEEQQI